MNAFERDLLIVLNDVARLLRTRFDQRARTYGMTRAQWIILARLQRQPGISQNEMAAICEVEPITVGRLVDRLESRGLVERRADPADRRIRRLHLLPASEPILAEIARYRGVLLKQITAGVDDETLNGLVDSLLRLKDNLASGSSDDDQIAAAGE
jgi:DNA-binding MarR family transcriptional regulator